ncbi:6-carboxytetrahydropterin synthase QueD [Candidatus Falkowbacteria bacterium CG10_big_fil_rev_8_21_14_0_10_43_10]|uniref:6-carboxy-5,6,7,8-tetrahydropterin synthase n=1 Tax=Candidatus Falkowbacteria bacterium CG10_big_fil_rev_8_21_14_0_10_43_10 TaxID=1974567 RepID=A0A2H0V157_9BACT|nr:MAG: 6-carboxytetrahydropterin synthase QueD [Candidatus Falkowbacteria bacterium CG10_big_fil_rev_8_21_14_0_10_43_10]
MLITKKFTLDSAHKLINYKGKCKNLHGHTYTLLVTIKGKINKRTGMVFDFGEIKKIVKEKVIDVLDHNYINNFIEQPTAENMIVWIWNQLEAKIKLYKLELSVWKLSKGERIAPTAFCKNFILTAKSLSFKTMHPPTASECPPIYLVIE